MKLPILRVIAVAATAAHCHAWAAEATVMQSHQAFDTEALTVRHGDVVHFENDDDVKHNIQVKDAADGNQDLGLQKPGETVDFTFAHPGEYQVRCSIHPRMRLKIVVE